MFMNRIASTLVRNVIPHEIITLLRQHAPAPPRVNPYTSLHYVSPLVQRSTITPRSIMSFASARVNLSTLPLGVSQQFRLLHQSITRAYTTPASRFGASYPSRSFTTSLPPPPTSSHRPHPSPSPLLSPFHKSFRPHAIQRSNRPAKGPSELKKGGNPVKEESEAKASASATTSAKTTTATGTGTGTTTTTSTTATTAQSNQLFAFLSHYWKDIAFASVVFISYYKPQVFSTPYHNAKILLGLEEGSVNLSEIFTKRGGVVVEGHGASHLPTFTHDMTLRRFLQQFQLLYASLRQLNDESLSLLNTLHAYNRAASQTELEITLYTLYNNDFPVEYAVIQGNQLPSIKHNIFALYDVPLTIGKLFEADNALLLDIHRQIPSLLKQCADGRTGDVLTLLAPYVDQLNAAVKRLEIRQRSLARSREVLSAIEETLVTVDELKNKVYEQHHVTADEIMHYPYNPDKKLIAEYYDHQYHPQVAAPHQVEASPAPHPPYNDNNHDVTTRLARQADGIMGRTPPEPFVLFTTTETGQVVPHLSPRVFAVFPLPEDVMPIQVVSLDLPPLPDSPETPPHA